MGRSSDAKLASANDVLHACVPQMKGSLEYIEAIDDFDFHRQRRIFRSENSIFGVQAMQVRLPTSKRKSFICKFLS